MTKKLGKLKMGNSFGDVRRFQFAKALEARLRNALMRAFKAAHERSYQKAILTFRENMRATEEIDDGRIPAGDYVHPKHPTKCRHDAIIPCYLIAMRNVILMWWEFQHGKVSDKDMEAAIVTLEKMVDGYKVLKVCGDIKAGYYIGEHDGKI